MSAPKHPIGTKIRFTQELTEPTLDPNISHIFAHIGDGGEIIGHDAKTGYQVTSVSGSDWFGASDSEFEVVR